MIANAYERLCELLGKTESDPAFGRFVEDVDDQFETKDDGDFHTLTFPRLGFQLVADTKSSLFYMFRLCMDSTVAVYSGDFPFGITSTDGPEDVQNKMGTEPVEQIGTSKAGAFFRRMYFNSSMSYAFLFDFDAETQQLLCFSVLWKDAAPKKTDESTTDRFVVQEVETHKTLRKALRFETPQDARRFMKELEPMREPNESDEELLRRVFPRIPDSSVQQILEILRSD